MDRRTFFRRDAATTAGAALTLLGSEQARGASVDSDTGEDLIRTAVSVAFVVEVDWKADDLDERNTHEVETPPGFTPCGLSINYKEYSFEVEAIDDEGTAILIVGEAFAEGPLEFWRPIKGNLKVRVCALGTPSVPPVAVVTIFGTIPRR